MQDKEYPGSCLCNKTTYVAKGEPRNPHLCSCTMCQRSSGAPTVAWVEFPLKDFKWTGKQPTMYRSSEKTQRCSCAECGGLLGTYNDGYPYVNVTICTLKNPNEIAPGPQHSFRDDAPKWWFPKVVDKTQSLGGSMLKSIYNNKSATMLIVAGFFAAGAMLYKSFVPAAQDTSNSNTPPTPSNSGF
jgi:hypothetical protein